MKHYNPTPDSEFNQVLKNTLNTDTQEIEFLGGSIDWNGESLGNSSDDSIKLLVMYTTAVKRVVQRCKEQGIKFKEK